MAGEMAGKKKKTRLLKRRELHYILERLRSADMAVFTAFVKKHVEEKEAVQLSFYEDRGKLWCAWSESGRLPPSVCWVSATYWRAILQRVSDLHVL